MNIFKVNAEEIISSGLLELYAAGLASEKEAELVVQAIANYPEVAAEFAAIENSLQSHAFDNAVEPSAAVKEKLFAYINTQDEKPLIKEFTPPAKVVSIFSQWKSIAAAAIFLLIGSTAMNIFLYKKNATTNRSLADAQANINALEEKASEMESNWKLVQSKYSQPVALSGMDVAPDAAAKVFWMKNTGEVFIDPSNLPEAPAGKQYHLWAIVGSKPVDAGVVLMDKRGNKYSIQKMRTFGRVEAFAVSLEEAGNAVMEAPKGAIYVMGKM